MLCDCDKISNRNGGGVKFLALFMGKDNKGPLYLFLSQYNSNFIVWCARKPFFFNVYVAWPQLIGRDMSPH